MPNNLAHSMKQYRRQSWLTVNELTMFEHDNLGVSDLSQVNTITVSHFFWSGNSLATHKA